MSDGNVIEKKYIARTETREFQVGIRLHFGKGSLKEVSYAALTNTGL